MVVERRLPYSDALERLDPDAIVSCLSDDVVIRVAVHDGPMEGTEVARFLFGVLEQELDGIEIDREIIEGDQAVVTFETGLEGLRAQGLNHLQLGSEGRVTELTVFFRPLASLAKIAEVIGRHMEARFGPRPD
jgi:ketosteroid isomerase-like protein